ncbi:phage minor head protein [Humitalea sp. 24SJ18S-53]|uniref:phage minor head protein n=1 Tax=Humitalea sp. 24SJ18S-53 TaxID=3422307 RepID=UPI003D66B9A8
MTAAATLGAISLPPAEAIAFFLQKTNTTSAHWTDVWRTAHSRQFMVAGAATEALVSDFRTAIQKAIEQGTTLAEFRGDFDGIVETHGWAYNGARGWRTRIIYETNLSTAYAAGRHAQMVQPETVAAFPYWQYVHSGALHPRLQHKQWNGLTLRATDAFWKSHYPPNGWRCGCRVEPQSGRDLARQGRHGPDAAPPIETRPWTNPRTGVTSQVPVGIDPGFDYNPGEAWSGPAPVPPGTRPPPAGWAPPPPVMPPTPGVSNAEFEALLRRAEAKVGIASPPPAPFVDLPPPPRRPPPTPPAGPDRGLITVPIVEPGDPPAAGGPPPPLRARVASPQRFARWLGEAQGDKARAPAPIVVGNIDRLTTLALRRNGGQSSIASRTVVIQPDKYRRIAGKDARISKASGMQVALAPADIARLPEILANPLAVFRQVDNGNLVYVFRPAGGDDGRVGKLVIALDRTVTVRGGDAARRKVTAASVISGGLTTPQALRPEMFTLLQGGL